jgi:hypothetical protein
MGRWVVFGVYLVAEGVSEFNTTAGYCKMGRWSGFGLYLLAEGGTEFGTATTLLLNGEMKWLLCVISG